METILPQHPETKSLLTKGVPVPGHNVTVRFGTELNFDDLIQAHEQKFGPLWKYNASVDDDSNADNFHAHWDSKPVMYCNGYGHHFVPSIYSNKQTHS